MTDQARKRAEEYFVREWDVIDLMSRDYIIDSHIDGQKVGHASALEEIRKGINDHDGETYAEEYCIEMGHSETEGHEEFEAVKHGYKIGRIVGNLQIATLRAQLEKCKEQRNRITTAMHNEDFRELDRNAKTQIANFDAELEALK